MKALVAFLRDDSGSTLTEYGVMTFTFAMFWLTGMLTIIATSNNLLTQIFTNTLSLAQCPPGTSGC